ncbi:MAG: hypothetical protein ROW52_13660, partial [Anaerolineaceae bacterium]
EDLNTSIWSLAQCCAERVFREQSSETGLVVGRAFLIENNVVNILDHIEWKTLMITTFIKRQPAPLLIRKVFFRHYLPYFG